MIALSHSHLEAMTVAHPSFLIAGEVATVAGTDVSHLVRQATADYDRESMTSGPLTADELVTLVHEKVYLTAEPLRCTSCGLMTFEGIDRDLVERFACRCGRK